MENWIFPTTCENIYFKLLWQTISDAFNSRHNFSDIKMIKYYAEQNSDAFSVKIKPHHWGGGLHFSMEGVAVNKYNTKDVFKSKYLSYYL